MSNYKVTLANGYSFAISEINYRDTMEYVDCYIFKINIDSNATAQSLFHKLESYLIPQNIKNVKIENITNGEVYINASFESLIKHEIIINEFGSMIQFFLK